MMNYSRNIKWQNEQEIRVLFHIISWFLPMFVVVDFESSSILKCDICYVILKTGVLFFSLFLFFLISSFPYCEKKSKNVNKIDHICACKITWKSYGKIRVEHHKRAMKVNSTKWAEERDYYFTIQVPLHSKVPNSSPTRLLVFESFADPTILIIPHLLILLEII